ncbi:hypothetical protein [Fulvimarina manganoxydans]|nr:hypothetical protein [Fulvimarina manganoxydans]
MAKFESASLPERWAKKGRGLRGHPARDQGNQAHLAMPIEHLML